ncbi:site-specific integrase [Prescottella equi]|uniref:tyrosine-type recombinase/integrase n=1 Tax=Rhodococcus hoagii TaxID=43767 RepID=UPI001F5B28F6|nr:site-specific integrase [Prescottella equi]UNQ40913.1 site-specific integrase [Prescottella equi]
MARSLPPGIKKIELKGRKGGRPEIRYEVLVDTGYVDGKRKLHRKRFKTEAEARTELSTVQAKVKGGSYVHPNLITVEDACAKWLESKHRIKASTLRGYKVWLAPLRKELGDTEVQKLTKHDLDTLIGKLRRGEVADHKKWTARSVNGMLGIFTAILEDMLKQGYVVRNVAKLVDRLPAEHAEMKTLTEAEMFRILDHDGRDRHLWTLALYGLRRGEIAGLKWSSVNFHAKYIVISENRVAVGSEIVSGTTKSKKSRRVLPMPEEVMEVLKVAHSRQMLERMQCGGGQSEYVASDEKGNPMNPNLLTFRWGRMLDDLGIERVRLHDARHSCATLMHLRGVPIAVIAAWLGHASAAFTMATYAHSQEDALTAAAQSFTRVATLCNTSEAEPVSS